MVAKTILFYLCIGTIVLAVAKTIVFYQPIGTIVLAVAKTIVFYLIIGTIFLVVAKTIVFYLCIGTIVLATTLRPATTEHLMIFINLIKVHILIILIVNMNSLYIILHSTVNEIGYH